MDVTGFLSHWAYTEVWGRLRVRVAEPSVLIAYFKK